jgi:short-subunit dehydrogenase
MQPAVVVTGASSGLGVEFARLAAAEGSKVVLVARSRPELEALAASLDASGQLATVLSLDLGAPDAGDVLARGLEELGLYCDILVNNAGFGLFGEAVELDRARQFGIIDVNVRAATDLMLRFLPAMVARRSGAILNVASISGFAPGPRMAVYFASKAYLISLSQALRQEVRDSGVTVTCLCPGPVRTPFLTRAGADQVALFKAIKKVDAADAARAGWEAMKAKRALCIPGFGSKVSVALTRIVPRSLMLALVGYLQRPRRHVG